MATRKDTAAFILAQLGHPGRFSVFPMFGEFALYTDGKVVGLICDDQLYLKVMLESKALERTCELAPPFPGAKNYYLVPENAIAAPRVLVETLLRMAAVLPFPKKKKSKRG
ncbi:MAG: TfoX/Sxy family protein [Flavobacteriales bacterium]|nr:MAG: TfoX/Sxy family protein [Flavobacteriales bacterium]